MSRETHELIRTAAEDLWFLRTEWDERIEDSSLRRSSVVLRRLLVEGEFGRAWRALGLSKQPIILAPKLELWLCGVPYNNIAWAQAGGARYGGVEVEGALESRGALSDEQIRRRFEAIGAGIRRDFSLKSFVESPCIVVEGTLVSRREVVKYVANKMGGVHPFDLQRNPGSRLDRQYQLLDSVREAGEIAGKNAIYFELLAIGQCLATSPDISSFLDRARHSLAP